MKLSILSNINIEPLKNQLQKIGLLDVYVGEYNQWQSELLNPDSGLYAFSPDFVFVYLNLEELQSEISDLFDCINIFSEKNKKTSFIISNVAGPPYSVLTYAEDSSSRERELNDALSVFASENVSVFILDFNRLIRFYGYKNLFDDKFWYLGRIKLSNQGFIVLAQELKNAISCLQGKSKKMLVVDLDNTLWGGILGEEGWQNIRLSQEGEERIFVDFQRKLKELRQTGVLLAICSKNNESDVREVFEKNKQMKLSWDDFILHRVNWETKPDNIIQIAGALNLGLDSIVFLDDNPVEREFVKQSLPDVIVPDFPEDISILNRWFVSDVVYPFFGKSRLTEEDREKTEQYKRNIDREKIKQLISYDEFIEQLDIRLTVFSPSTEQAFRIAQLTQKTNRFNLSGKRFDEAEINAMLENSDYKIFACEYEDKFGNEGIIGCAVIQIKKEKALIDSFYLSCRVLGRKVEFSFLNHILYELKKSGIESVDAEYIETGRNVSAKDFYEKGGFSSGKILLWN